jgi:FkbM family methyltransferase
MKLKEIFFGLGLRPGVKEYPYLVDTFQLEREGQVSFARWQHPRERRKEIAQPAVDALRGFLKSGDAAIDVGAHTGDTALPMALAVGPTGAVFALEPNPYTFKVLRANAGLNREKTNIVPLMFAATTDDDELEFEYSDSGFCNGGLHPGISHWRHGHFFKLKVQGRNVLKFLKEDYPQFADKVRFLKVDTEGYDPQVVASLKELVIKNRPFIRSEVYEHLPAEARFKYYDDLRALGYRVFKFVSVTQYRGEELTREQMMQWRHFDIFATPE